VITPNPLRILASTTFRKKREEDLTKIIKIIWVFEGQFVWDGINWFLFE